MSGLNGFQSRCKRLLEEIVEDLGAWFSDFHVEDDGGDGQYLQITIQPGEIDVQVSVDVVSYVVGDRVHRLEVISSYREDQLLSDLAELIASDIREISNRA